MALLNKVVFLTGASMGIGEAIASALAKQKAKMILVSRSEDKLKALVVNIKSQHPECTAIYRALDISDNNAVTAAVASSVEEIGAIDILINNAGLALGAPAPFPQLKNSDILTMNETNVNGMMQVTHAVLNRCMLSSKAGTILNITSITGLEVPPFPGEAVYHANKASQEAFTNALRNELSETNIRVLVLRPGCVATNFHSQRVGHDKELYEKFFEGFQPLVPDDIAQAAMFMVTQPLNVSVKSLDIVPSAQRSLNVFDRTWNDRNGF